MIIGIKSKPWVFMDMQENTYDLNIPSDKDPDDMCCKMGIELGVPFKCYPKILETSSGVDRGKIIV